MNLQRTTYAYENPDQPPEVRDRSAAHVLALALDLPRTTRTSANASRNRRQESAGSAVEVDSEQTNIDIGIEASTALAERIVRIGSGDGNLEPIARSLTAAPMAREHVFLSGGGAPELSPVEKEQAARERCQQYIERRVAGIFFAPLELTPNKDAVNGQITAALQKAGIPVVLLDRSVVPYGWREAHDLVGIDNRRAGYQITDHLLRLGSRRIAFLSFRNSASTVDARRAGYREALHCHGAPVDPAYIVELDRDAAHGVTSLMSAHRPEAVVCANDRTAGLVMQTLQSLGYGIPEDVRIVGIDDVHYASLLPVPLTTLRQPCREIGTAAMAAMLERLTSRALPPRDILLHTPLIVRRSCGSTLVLGGSTGFVLRPNRCTPA